MATVFLVKDGPRGNRTNEGMGKTVEELTSLLVSHNCLFLDEEPPEFNTAQPGDYYRHVMIEITSNDQTNNKFPRVGFYVVANLDASQSTFLFKKSCCNRRSYQCIILRSSGSIAIAPAP